MKRVSIGLATLALMSIASSARAETPDELFRRGRALAAEQRYSEACPLLAESVKAEPGVGARLWLGECYEKTGRLASALAEFKAAAAQSAERKDEREKVATRHALAIEPRVPRILVVAPEGVTLTVDDTEVAATIADPVDAGLHTITASAPGFVRWTVSVSVPDAPGTITVNVPVLEPEAHAAPAPAPVVSPVAPVAPTTQVVVHTPGLNPLKIASIATGAVGLAALGGGVFLGLQAKSTYDSSNQGGHCVNNACDASGKDLRSSANGMATLSTIAFASAGAAIASSIVLFVLAPSTTVTPSIGTHEAGLSLAQRF